MPARTSLPLSDLELDALTELVNIGVSRAATSLRDMVGKQVTLSVPRIDLLSCVEAARTISEKEGNALVGVHQSFEGDLTGRALLIFPEANSLELVRAVTGGDLPLEDIVSLEQEALAETGNIILNNCLSTIANMLNRSFKISLPQIVHGTGATIFDLSGCEEGKDAVLFLYIDFNVMERDIRGYITMLMDLPALTSLQKLLQEFIRRTTGEQSGA
ncbi:MAG TPA: chemotaxis protein CheC [Hyphomonadaceae bacterium]|jgi:chemotaxis protein CheC|nr:chemotaxis protein CheC [Hyphomonadaceae bacterium]